MSNMNNDVMMTAEAPKKNWGYRLFAVLLIAVCALAVAGLKFYAIYDTTVPQLKNDTLLQLLPAMLDCGGVAFGVMPAFNVVGTIGSIYTLAFYLFVAGIALAAIFAFFAIFTGKNAPMLVRTALFYFTAGAMLYTFTFTLACETYAANNVFGSAAMEGALANMPVVLDIFSFALAAVGAVLYFAFATKKAGKVAWLYLLQALLTAVFMVLIANPITKSNALVSAKADQITKIAVAAGLIITLATAMISIGRMSRKGGIVFDLVRYFVVLIVALLIIAKTSAVLFGILAVVVVVAQIIITIIQLIKSKKANIEEIREEAVQEVHSGFHVEEYVEAYPYEGGPVAGVLMAEEVNPSFLPHEPHVNTAGYDFYNCKSFDPFIATLDTAERNEFTELFILKFKGTMPELPDYEVGGDNKEFFRKVFIYLGQYRDRMSQTLLMKMYQFSMKI